MFFLNGVCRHEPRGNLRQRANNFLNGVCRHEPVEYAFQFDQIGHEEYRHWVAEIEAIEAQKTEQLLKVLTA